MTSRIQKRLLLPNRVRRPPHEGFSFRGDRRGELNSLAGEAVERGEPQ
jgi:hypothetical protein